jgi:hypothetical protein
MNLKRLPSSALVGIALVLAGVAITGCGSASGGSADESSQTDGESQTYGEVLRGLRNAAQSGATYGAVRRAKDFEAGERDVIRSFCEFAWQIGVNREARKLSDYAYVINRIRLNAYREGNADGSTITPAAGKLDRVVDLAAITGPKLKRYTKACYR